MDGWTDGRINPTVHTHAVAPRKALSRYTHAAGPIAAAAAAAPRIWAVARPRAPRIRSSSLTRAQISTPPPHPAAAILHSFTPAPPRAHTHTRSAVGPGPRYRHPPASARADFVPILSLGTPDSFPRFSHSFSRHVFFFPFFLSAFFSSFFLSARPILSFVFLSRLFFSRRDEFLMSSVFSSTRRWMFRFADYFLSTISSSAPPRVDASCQ